MPAHKDNEHGTTRLAKISALAAVAVIVAVVALVGTAAAQNSQRFEDVPSDHYAYDSIEWAVANGITAGCGDGTNFCPDTNLNRAHMVTFLKRYHDNLGTGVTLAWGEPVDASGGVTLTGSGSDLAGPLTLTGGRWGVVFTVEPGAGGAYVGVKAFGDDPGGELLVNEIVEDSAYSKTTQFRVGDHFLDDLAPGSIWFEVTADSDMMWTITVAPL